VCCSGGGIRAAAFALGGIQGLSRRRPHGRRSWFDDCDLITAVSGGSYLAGSYAWLNHSVRMAGPGAPPAYAPGSPEDIRLRTHTRYLVEDPKVAAVGVLNILYGLVINLLPLLAGIYVVATVLGRLLRNWGLLERPDGVLVLGELGLAGKVVLGLALAALVAFTLDRWLDVYVPPQAWRSDLLRTWTLRLLLLALAVLVLCLGVPTLLAALAGEQALIHLFDWLPPLPAGLGATTLAIAGAVKATLGRFRGKLQTSSQPGPTPAVPAFVGAALRWVAAWVGSALCVLLLGAAFLTWVDNAADEDKLSTGQLQWLVAAVVGMVAWQALFDVNRNSIHPFYRERLSSAFFAAERAGDGKTLEPLDYSKTLLLSTLADDRPALVICAAVNTDEEGVVPSGRGCAPFTFSAKWCGISSGVMFDGEDMLAAPPRMQPTESYQQIAGRRIVTLPGAVAVSGAAVSPAMGRMTRAPLRLLLGLANVRLGLWLPNPSRVVNAQEAPAPERGRFRKLYWQLGQTLRWQLRQPGIPKLLAEILGRTRLDGRWVYVTDGGHYENLGLVEALRRGARQIVAFDASGDPPDTWEAFGQSVQTARADLGVEIALDPSAMRPPTGELGAPTLVVRGSCTYPDGTTAELYLCKLAMPAKASWDIHAWQGRNPAFPNDSTLHQLYGDREFEAYRRLGEIAAEHARALLEERSIDLTHAQIPPSTAARAAAGGSNGAGIAAPATTGGPGSRSMP